MLNFALNRFLLQRLRGTRLGGSMAVCIRSPRSLNQDGSDALLTPTLLGALSLWCCCSTGSRDNTPVRFMMPFDAAAVFRDRAHAVSEECRSISSSRIRRDRCFYRHSQPSIPSVAQYIAFGGRQALILYRLRPDSVSSSVLRQEPSSTSTSVSGTSAAAAASLLSSSNLLSLLSDSLAAAKSPSCGCDKHRLVILHAQCEDGGAVVQQAIAHFHREALLRWVSASWVQILSTMIPPAPQTTRRPSLRSRVPWPGVAGRQGTILSAPARNTEGKGEANAAANEGGAHAEGQGRG
ncbi:hypothetical protein V8D89_006264, partial [Ganoderma adspersum]